MSCGFCKGTLTEGKVNHIVDLGEGIIIIKDVPANVCKQCGEYYVGTPIALALESMVEEVKKNRAEVLIINYDDIVT